MLINADTAVHILDTAIEALSNDQTGFSDTLDQLPAAIYVTDTGGTITYYNRACVELAGRTPAAGDKWCVTWKLYTLAGDPLPHDECPMAVAIRERRAVRDVEAIAERPDGTRTNFVPFPTPLFDADGNLAGAVNLLLEVSGKHKPDYLREQAAKCRELASDAASLGTAETLSLMATKYDEQALKLGRSLSRELKPDLFFEKTDPERHGG
jgi:PAS domain-containing protein